MKQKFITVEVPPSGRKGWMGGAFTLVFLYDRSGKNYLIKGFSDEVEDYIDKHFVHYFAHFNWIGNKKTSRGMIMGTRTMWKFSNACNLTIETPRIKQMDYRTRYLVQPWGYEADLDMVRLTFKRMPNKWIPEFTVMVEKYGKQKRKL